MQQFLINNNGRLNAHNLLGLIAKAIKTEVGIRTMKFVKSEVDLYFGKLITKAQNSANTVGTKLSYTESKDTP